ncbi:MAG TPA: thioredoxin domain-containing protein, partial [Gemmatimonadaceae bacterium]|nr:thioredoxin domain-containing protein [Gemmatimonadaceae bacterium]
TAPAVVEANAPLPKPQGIVAGSDSAPVEIIEFGDFECPVCGQFATITEPDVMTRLVKTGRARFRYLDFPLYPRPHPAALVAHNAALCAADQNKFWEMHDRIYATQFEWSTFANGRDMGAPRLMKRYAKELGLDTKAFDACFDASKFEPQIKANQAEGFRVGMQNRGTPTFFIGKRVMSGALPYDVIKAMVDSATADAKKPTSSRGGPGSS